MPYRDNNPRPIRVLLVEDDDGDALLVSELFADADVPVELVRARTVDEALTLLDVDCILLDLTLPDATGLEALAQLHYVAPDVPIVVFSGVDGEDLAVRAVAEGAQDYLVKGQAPGPLVLRSVRYAVERKQAELQLAELALTDALTGLPNRVLFLDRLGHALDRLRRSNTVVAVLFVDVDQFNIVSNSVSHTVGDMVLAEPVGDHFRFYAFGPGDLYPFFVGDDGYSYGFAGRALAAVYGGDAQLVELITDLAATEKRR